MLHYKICEKMPYTEWARCREFIPTFNIITDKVMQKNKSLDCSVLTHKEKILLKHAKIDAEALYLPIESDIMEKLMVITGPTFFSDVYEICIETCIKNDNFLVLNMLWNGLYDEHDAPNYLQYLLYAEKYGSEKMLTYILYAYMMYKELDHKELLDRDDFKRAIVPQSENFKIFNINYPCPEFDDQRKIIEKYMSENHLDQYKLY